MTILYVHLQARKFCARWLPCRLGEGVDWAWCRIILWLFGTGEHFRRQEALESKSTSLFLDVEGRRLGRDLQVQHHVSEVVLQNGQLVKLLLIMITLIIVMNVIIMLAIFTMVILIRVTMWIYYYHYYFYCGCYHYHHYCHYHHCYCFLIAVVIICYYAH